MPMASVIVSASTGAMNSVIGKLTSLLGEEYKLIKSVKRGIRFLRDELSAMNAVLENLANMEEQMNVQTREWRDKVRDMSYDIEDCIDRFLQRHSLVGTAKPNFVRKAERKLKKLWEDRQIGKEIRELKALVEEEKERMGRYKIDQFLVNPQPVPLDPRAPEYYQAAKDPVGIDGPREKITRWLIDEEKQPKVVAIYGIGGSGKTTLAAEVYHKIEEPFDSRAFVSVSRTPDIKRLLKDMLFQLDREEYDKSGMWEKEQLISVLMKCLRDKRYLIVIDDIWSISEAWEHVRSALPINDKRSRIIATTRSKDVAISCCADFDGHMYEESLLTEEDSRILFFRRILRPSEDLPQELREVSTEILRKCGGLPLAIISIASLLANKSRTVEVWVKIRNSISSAVEKDSPVDRMKRILFLSYFDLPHYLKTCLLYLSVFPEDYYIDCRFLIWRWVAEGIITGVSREDMECRGESYLNALINRSLIQPRKIGADGTTVKFCGVHDIILDFIISQAVEDNFVTIWNGNALCKYSSNKIRRLSLQLNFPEAADLPTEVDVSHLRSLHKFGMSTLRQVPQNCESLRVLNIEGVWGLQNCHIEHIGSFSLLKYLRIVGDVSPVVKKQSLDGSMARRSESLEVQDEAESTDEEECTDEVQDEAESTNEVQDEAESTDEEECTDEVQDEAESTNEVQDEAESTDEEETTDEAEYTDEYADEWYVKPNLASTCELPEQMGNLQHLEVLDLRGITFGKLPATIVHLQKLVRLFVGDYMVLPDGIGNLQCLEELSKINLGKASIRFIQGLAELTKLRVLEIGWFSSKYECDDIESREKVWSASLTKLVANTLQSLHFTYFESSDFIDSWVFSSVSCPPLRRLVLHGVDNFGFPTIPSQIASLTNLTRLSIARACEMGEEGVKILGSLPALLSLKLMLGYGVRESHVIGSQGFQRLVKLHFMGEKSLTFEAGAMPKLQRMKLKLTHECQYKPGGLVQGLLHLSSLRHISIRVFCFTIYHSVEDMADQIRSVTSIHPNLPILETWTKIKRRKPDQRNSAKRTRGVQ